MLFEGRRQDKCLFFPVVEYVKKTLKGRFVSLIATGLLIRDIYFFFLLLRLREAAL